MIGTHQVVGGWPRYSIFQLLELLHTTRAIVRSRVLLSIGCGRSTMHPGLRQMLTWILWPILAGWIPVAVGSTGGPPLVLENLSTRDGLPQGDVMVTLQDSQGFVWFGTEDGLVRFDGHEIYRYAYSPTVDGGLPGNFVDAIAEDKNGDLWIGIKGSGLAQWHRSTDTFTVYRHDPRDPDSLASDTVRTILVDGTGLIWIGTMDAGIDLLAPVEKHFRHMRHVAIRADSLADDQIQTLMQDHSGTIWVGTRAGLNRWREADRFARYPLQQDIGAAGKDEISQIIEDAMGSLWIGTFSAGLYHVDRNGKVIGHFGHDGTDDTSLSYNDVRAVLDDHAGHLWVGTAEGLNLLNRETNRFSHYGHDKADPDSLSDSFVMSLYQDASGLVWIGTRAGGVSRWNPHSWELGGNRPDWLEGKLVTAFADAPDNRLWIGSVGGGLMQLDVVTGKAVDIDSILHRQNALGDRRVMSLHTDSRNDLWIGTMTNGLKKLSHGRIVSIPVRVGDPHSLSASGIVTIYEARDGLLWIGTNGGGANVLDPSTGIVRQLPFASNAPGSLSSENITAFVEDRQGNFWIGTDSGGLNLARRDGSVLTVFRHDPKDPTSLSANTIYSLTMDSSGRIWIATDGGGLDLVVGSSASPESIRFRTISRATGLSSDTIYGVLPDTTGHLWLSGNAGLMRYDPLTGAVKTYHRENGLQGEEFDFGAFYRTRDGRDCFGGPGGFNVFDPSQLAQNRTPPRLALTNLEVLGAPVQSSTPYWLMKRIALSYRANIVSLDFAALDFTSLNRNQLAYRMMGLTDDWINLGALRRVTLTNLEAGDHVLEVQAVNGDSVRSTPLRLTIHKEPAPWRSPAAYTAYVVMLLGLVVLGLRAQRHKLRRALAAQQRLESEVALRTQELSETNRQLVVASEAKSSFLARMGHELRTPMNGVVGMTELLARTSLTVSQARQTQTIRSSAQTLLQILNDLLDLSKVQAGKIELETLPVDLVQIGDECAALFSVAAENKGIDLIICPPRGDHWNLLGDPLRIRQILMNLIGNAVKFTERGEIVVTCDVTAQVNGEAAVNLIVTDTGIGMTDAAMGKIFEPFTQADETTTRRFGGTGLGLSICHEFVELMGGSIEVTSVPQVGSTFDVSLSLRMAAPHQQQEEPWLAGWSARFLTRRQVLSESLNRYLSAFKPELFEEIHELIDFTPGDAEILLLDADSYPGTLERFARAGSRSNTQLIVIATSKAIDSQGVGSLVGADRIVRKPISRGALRDALKSVIHAPIVQRATRPDDATELSTGRGHVLIVEDEHINAAVAEGYLTELGCTSVWVESGAAAIARNAVERFDIIFMDLNMPGLDGFAAAALIRKSERASFRTPIVALTANDAAEYRDSCLLAGMDDILSKPYSFAECAELVRRWVGSASTSPPEEESIKEELLALSSVDTATVASLKGIQSRGNTDLYVTLVAMFENSSSSSLAQIRLALLAEDFPAAGAVCHKLKSSAGNVGALAFANVVVELERFCIAKNIEAAWRLYERISSAHPLLVGQLKSLTLRATA
jgi:signal transduction histidine kinase/ligand-binding sensor domain-containing protein/CheY-like chemotaxis protein/HPt (histidine-containing phosphotransfer) domain-containing protein